MALSIKETKLNPEIKQKKVMLKASAFNKKEISYKILFTK